MGLSLALLLVFTADTYAKMAPADEEGYVLQEVRESWLVQKVSPHNPADRYMVPELLRVLILYRSDPQVIEDARADPHLESLLSDPVLKAAIEDKGLQDALERWDLQAIRHNKSLQALREDDELWSRVFSEETRASLRRLIEAADEREATRAAEDEDAEPPDDAGPDADVLP
jgi:hypothetical protein